MPSPYCATPGMVTGVCPVIAISPNSAFTAEISDGTTVLNVVIATLACGNDESTYGAPTATSTGELNLPTKAARSGASVPPLKKIATTTAEHEFVSPSSSVSAASGIEGSANITRAPAALR